MLIVNEAEAAIVRRMFDMALRGDTIGRIARRLTAERIPSPMAMRGDVRQGKKWGTPTVARILHHRLYTGAATWNKRRRRSADEQIQVQVPRIIEADTFDAVQENLKRSVTFVPRNQQRFYLLKGLLFCSCGRRMFGICWHGTRYYHCADKSSKECGQPSLRADDLENVVSTEVTNALMRPDAVLALADRQGMNQRDELLMRLDSLNEQLARLPEARSRLIDAHTEDTINKAEFKEKMRGLEEKKARLEQERKSLQASMGKVQADELDARHLAEILAKHNRPSVLQMSGEEWAEIVRAVIKRVTINKDGAMTFEAVVPLEPIISEAARASAESLQGGQSPERTLQDHPAEASAGRDGKQPLLPGSGRRSARKSAAPEPQEASGSSQTDGPGRYLTNLPSQCAARWPQSPASAPVAGSALPARTAARRTSTRFPSG